MRKRIIVKTFKQYLLLFMVFLVVSSGILPMYPAPLYAEGNQSEDGWVLSKEVEGQTSKEVGKEEFSYDINLKVPDDLEEFENLTVIDEIDSRLTIQQVKVMVDDEVDSIPSDLDGQTVSVELTGEELQELAGKTVTVQVTVQLNDYVDAGEQIENIAEVIGDGTSLVESNNVTVTVVGDEEQLVEEEEAESESEPEQEQQEEASEEEETVVGINNVEVSNVLEINNIDSYGISNNTDRTTPQIRQFDGGNFDPDPKAIVFITGLPSGVNMNNGLAVHPTENAFYAYGGFPGDETAHRLYRITPDGSAEFVGGLDGTAANAVISQDGTRYYHTYIENGVLLLGSYHLGTGEKGAIPINGYDNNDVGGDLIIDEDGYIWFSNNTAGSIIQMDAQTGEVLRQVPITSGDGVSLQGGVRGLSFLPNGQILLSSGPGAQGSQRADYFSLDPETLQTTFLGSATIAGDGRFFPSFDLASRVYPRFDPLPPVIEAEKSVELVEKGEGNTDDENPEVGDTLRYTIQARNTIENSLLQNLVISDTIPEGLEYVQGTLKVDGQAVTDEEDNDKGHYVNGDVVGQFGDIADTEWHTLEFDVIILPGQAGRDIDNTASVVGDNVDEPEEPSEIVEVYPRDGPVVRAEKSVSPEEEVFDGDVLTYNVTITNVGEHLAANTVFEDVIPEGTEYVPGSMRIVTGPNAGDLTDEDDDDAGHFDGEKVTIQLGNIQNRTELPDGITVQFRVIALTSHLGETVVNKADVHYRNLQTDEAQTTESNEVTNTIIERPVIDACARPVALINGSFEQGPERGSYNGSWAFLEEEVPGWLTTDDSQGEKIIEIWDYEQNYPSVVRNFPAPPDGNRYAELNAYEHGMLYQDVETTPGQTIYWRLSHMGRQGVDTMQVRFGPATDNPYDTIVQTQMSTGNTAWETYTGTYTVPAGQTVTRFGFEAVSTANGVLGAGNFLDDIFLGTEPCVVAEKSVSPEGEVVAGDELTYEVTIKNEGGDIAADVVFEDAIPEGTEYVPGSMRMVTGPNAGDLTDADDDDAGHFDGEKVIIHLGDLPNTTDLPDGITVQFKVTALSSHIGESIVNQASVGYKNLLTGEDETTESNEVTTPVEYKAPELEAEKTATLLEKAEGNTDEDHPEVGDTLLYTIQARNTIEDSLVENLVISDVIPEGLEYVPGTLRVNGEAVTDAEDDDAGHYVDGEVVGQFGNVTDTEWRTLEFQVTVGEGQASQDIENVAVVEGDNVDEPERPSEEVKIYPRFPSLESEKTATNVDLLKDRFEVGDTIVYTIRARNTVSESLLENLVITDELPEGITYVEGSLDVSHDGTGSYEDGTITANFGDVTDTEWRIVRFRATIDSGYAGETIENIAVVEGDNVDEPSNPREEVKVEPKDPELEAEKTATLLEKAEGNTDEGHPEVGDTLLYTIQARNTIEDSLVENLVISDVIPAGLEYVPGTLRVNGEAVTDAEDDDAGHYVDGEIVGQFGNVTDTEWRTLEFQVTVGEGQASQDIENIAIVDGDNVDEPERPSEEVKIYPRFPNLESEKTATNVDEAKDRFEAGDTIVYTIRARNTVSESLLENLVVTDELPEGLTYVEGSLDVSHDGAGSYEGGIITANFGDVTDTEWRTVTFHATIDSGYVGETIENIAVVDGDNIDEPSNPREEVTVEPKDPVLEAEKTATLQEKAEGNTNETNPEVGDTLLYTIQARNTIEDSLIKSLVIYDVIPEGLEYVPGTLKVNGEVVTDEEDADQGHYDNGEVFGHFGDVTDTEWRTLEFEVTVLQGQAGQDINNIAVVNGDNVDEPNRPEEEVKIYPRSPVLEAEKTATNVDEAKERFEAGDTVVYTIRARNTIEDSLIEDMSITDELPEGLTYVEGSLEVSHDGEGSYEDGTITATFGDVMDTEWRTVTFHATIDSGYVGETIENVAVVDGGNVDEPSTPEEGITVSPKAPVLEAEKTATNLEEVKTTFEVGDTVVYTIRARNTIADSLLENLVITDELPEGLTYVEGSLEVSHNGTGSYEGGTITASFGDVTDTEWRTVTFHATIDSGYVGETIENVATVEGDNVDEPHTPQEEITISPKAPVLEAEKTATNLDEGKETYDVGDTIVYTIRARNTVSDSTVKNLVITDQLPEGITYVEGSLDVSHNGTGSYEGGTITATFGDVTDTEWRTVTFEATIDSGYAGETIQNVAVVNGDNVETPEQPTENVTVDPEESPEEPKEPKDPMEKPHDPEKPVDSNNPPTSGGGDKLPKTATNTFLILAIGLGLLLVGLFLQYLNRKRKAA